MVYSIYKLNKWQDYLIRFNGDYKLQRGKGSGLATGTGTEPDGIQMAHGLMGRRSMAV